MRSYTRSAFLLLLFAGAVSGLAIAHPTGNLVSAGKYLLWPYVSPIDDPDHHACVMIWQEGTDPEVLLRSEHPASDFMLSSRGNEIHIIERRYLPSSQTFEIRVMKMTIGEHPVVMWDWFLDEWNTGEGGFYMPSDEQIVFVKYPHLYIRSKGEAPVRHFEPGTAVKRLRALPGDQLLLLGDSDCWLTDLRGTILRSWSGLLEPEVEDAPLNRNQIFDADYRNGELLLAYWGRRSFDLIAGGTREVLVQQREPLTPHWVAFHGDRACLFSSTLIFDGSNPRPFLTLRGPGGDDEVVWED
jgi:hypothetical protein